MTRTKERPSDQCDRGQLRAYDIACDAAGECSHGIYGGAVVRPWCDSPACPICRHHRHMWRSTSTARSFPAQLPYHD